MKLSSDEKIFYEMKPMQKLILIWFFTKCIVHGLAFALFTCMVWWFYANISSINKGIILEEYKFFLLMGFVLFVFGTLISYIYNRFLLKTITYYITDRRCVWKGGIVRKVEHSVSYYKITDVERSQNIIEQLLNISTINLFTPGTASMRMGAGARSQPVPELRFEGLQSSEDEAESINEQIRKYGHSMP